MSSKYSLYHATPEDWTTILMLAHRWSFPEVKKLAIRELEKLEMADIQRIHVYQTYDVNRRLLVTRYAALCERLEPLTLEEGIKLGMATSLMIARARECVRSPSVGGCRSPSSVSIPSEEMQNIIKDLFKIPDSPSSPSTSPVEEPKKQTNGTATKTSGGWVIPSFHRIVLDVSDFRYTEPAKVSEAASSGNGTTPATAVTDNTGATAADGVPANETSDADAADGAKTNGGDTPISGLSKFDNKGGPTGRNSPSTGRRGGRNGRN